MNPSSVSAVKAWLWTNLQTACTPAPGVALLVRYALPGPYEPEDIVSLGDVTGRQVKGEAFTGGQTVAGSLQETYIVLIDVDCVRSGTDPGQSVTERTWALVAQIEAMVRTDPTLGGTANWANPEVGDDHCEWDDDHLWLGCHVTVGVRVRAQI